MTTQYYWDFCCRSGGNNLNAGTLTANKDDGEPATTPLVTYASGTWVASTGVFTVASGNPTSDGVAVGHWASVYPDGTSPDTVFVGRITARGATTITVSLTDQHGTAPTNGTNTRTLRVGGAWAGPTGSSGFPITNFLRRYNFSTYIPAVNFKNDQTYNITAVMQPLTDADQVKISGYTSTYDDGGKATIDGGTSGASYKLLFLGVGDIHWMVKDFIFQNNGATGNATLVDGGTVSILFFRCVFAHSRGWGSASARLGYYECEAYDCNQSNTATTGGIAPTHIAYNCISHHNTGSNSIGFGQGGFQAPACVQCIAHANGGHGFLDVSPINCDSYDNGGDGYRFAAARSFYAENSNALANTGAGFNWMAGVLGDYACLRYGAGTMANGGGGNVLAATAGVGETSPASAYPADVHPWTDPDNGDFRISLGEAMGTGRGEFTQEDPSYSDITTMYPDIGAVWHKAGMRLMRRMDGGF